MKSDYKNQPEVYVMDEWVTPYECFILMPIVVYELLFAEEIFMETDESGRWMNCSKCSIKPSYQVDGSVLKILIPSRYKDELSQRVQNSGHMMRFDIKHMPRFGETKWMETNNISKVKSSK